MFEIGRLKNGPVSTSTLKTRHLVWFSNDLLRHMNLRNTLDRFIYTLKTVQASQIQFSKGRAFLEIAMVQTVQKPEHSKSEPGCQMFLVSQGQISDPHRRVIFNFQKSKVTKQSRCPQKFLPSLTIFGGFVGSSQPRHRPCFLLFK